MAYLGAVGFGPNSEIIPFKESYQIDYGNVAMIPIPGTFHALPWAGSSSDGRHRVAEVLCETAWLSPFKDGARQGACTRHVAARQLTRLADAGYELKSCYEAEFMVFRRDGGPRCVPAFPIRGGLTSHLLFSEYEDFVFEMDLKLAAAGVRLVAFHTECGAGQLEFVTRPEWGIDAADGAFTLKSGVKEMCLRRGLEATSMSKPVLDQAGNGLHFNHSLWTKRSTADDDPPTENAFYDADRPDGLSAVARHWLAGLIRHGPALTALCSPTVNCYRRVHTEWAPDRIDWGPDSRFAAFRAKSTDASATYVENRLVSGAANPYLALAATVAAGLDGVVKRLELPPPRRGGPVDDAGLSAPDSLPEALRALRDDEVMVAALGDEFVDWFVEAKTQLEIKRLGDDVDRPIEKDLDVYYKFF